MTAAVTFDVLCEGLDPIVPRPPELTCDDCELASVVTFAFADRRRQCRACYVAAYGALDIRPLPVLVIVTLPGLATLHIDGGGLIDVHLDDAIAALVGRAS